MVFETISPNLQRESLISVKTKFPIHLVSATISGRMVYCLLKIDER